MKNDDVNKTSAKKNENKRIMEEVYMLKNVMYDLASFAIGYKVLLSLNFASVDSISRH